jgi:hypothetical protein
MSTAVTPISGVTAVFVVATTGRDTVRLSATRNSQLNCLKWLQLSKTRMIERSGSSHVYV